MKSSSPVRIAVIVLIITAAWIAVEHVLGFNTTRHDIGQYTRLLPAFVFWASIFVVVRNEKRKAGTLTFRDGFKAGVLSALVYSFGFMIIIIIYQGFINPQFYETFKAFSLANLQERSATPGEIEASMKEIEMSYSGSALSYALLFVFSFAWGVILSAIAALIYKSKQAASTVAS